MFLLQVIKQQEELERRERELEEERLRQVTFYFSLYGNVRNKLSPRHHGDLKQA